ncbi:hypothetical protein LRAMOSA09799 [Lichtheimia ramosa]|uniref:Mediator of RNA polymerase II transcription subunit 7 n=1 Tax=Lichtheimia ramosa TaxID=688394 RepID=A0A077WNX6_9FUNG|nr:hypothetical protein LRAMOSA09799 [Lichtheimia ramosa]
MNEAQSNASAWPDPPFLYKRYTADNLDKLHNARKKGAFPDTPISQPLYPDFSLKALEPPPPPTESYTIFDQRWQVHESLQSLSDLGVRQLFPEGNIDPIRELKKLNRSLMNQYLQLLQTLVENPQEYGQKIENISTIFINMHHILNEYRPHQARETLRLLMENQITRKREMVAELRNKSRQMLRDLQEYGQDTTKQLLTADESQSQPQPSEEKDTSQNSQDITMQEHENTQIDMNQHRQNMISMIDDIQ